MNKGQAITARKYFIEKVIGQALKVKTDFAFIKYAHTAITDSEYVRVADTLGRAITLDITALTLEEVLDDSARLVLAGKENVPAPYSVITDTQKLREIAPLFK